MALHGVMLGPANPISVDMLQAVLQKNGFADTKIDKSVGYFRAPN